MWPWLNETLNEFKYCFSDKRTYVWFVISVIGLMLRSDHIGMTSFIRELSLHPSSYSGIQHFFKTSGWCLLKLQRAWQCFLSKSPFLYRVAGSVVIPGDGIKTPKEARHMPGVKKLHQESENSSKGEYIFGHMFGGLSVLMGSPGSKLYSVLISLRLHDGLEAIHEWSDEEPTASHVVQLIRDAAFAVSQFGKTILLLDRLFLTVPMLTELSKTPLLQAVTKAKMNVVAYFDPEPKTGRGPKPKKGEKVSVASFFTAKAEEFVSTTATLYGKTQEVSYYCTDLLWGKKLYQRLRFVLAVFNGTKTILVSTDLTLSPEQIITLYSHRFKIECAFRELKQVIAGFGYRFWSKYMPKLKKFVKNDANQDAIRSIADENAQRNIKATVEAIEKHALLSCIALGLLQLISLKFADAFNGSVIRFMRTKSNAIPSEATVADFMRKNIYQLFRFYPDLPITAIISSKQNDANDYHDRNGLVA
jgi:hypothetical protein